MLQFTQSKTRRNEIGSEFWDVPVSEQSNSLFPENTQWFLSGRSALKAIIAENRFQTVGMPAWCCESMTDPFLEAGISVVFYTAGQSVRELKTDALLVMDYFGYTTDLRADGFHGVVIRDVTHSLFSQTYDDADYSFGSLRKWAGFLTGGFAVGFKQKVTYTDSLPAFASRRREAMRQKEDYIYGRRDSKDYLPLFSEAEKMLDAVGIAEADEGDIALANRLDVSFIRNRRRSNAKYLMSRFQDKLLFPTMADGDCPMFVPIRVKNRDTLRQYLIENAIYCPVHWPLGCRRPDSVRCKDLYDEELSLVCDQRYDRNDMERLADVITQFQKGVE